jgi:hypothetical protein
MHRAQVQSSAQPKSKRKIKKDTTVNIFLNKEK